MSERRRSLRAEKGAARRLALLVLPLAAWLLVALSAGGPAHAQEILALVNGEPITSLDVQSRARLVEAVERRRVNRKEALEELIDQKVKLHQARRLGLSISDAEVDRTMAMIARGSGRTGADLANALWQAGISVQAFRTKLRVDLAWREVLQKMVPGAFQVRDADIVAALVARGQTPTAKATQYTLRRVVFVVPRAASNQVRMNRFRSAEALRAKFSDCERDIHLAREYPEVVIMEPLVRVSTDLSPPLRQLLDNTPDGRMTPPEATANGIEIVAVCSRKETIADLGSRQEIREQLLAQRVIAQEKQILDELRRKAIVEYR